MAPPGSNTRPTGDRVREAVFNSLGSLGVVDEARVLDLFAGTGAMGIEALSRGAHHSTFVERSREVAMVIDQNLATTGLTDRASVIVSDVGAFLRSNHEAHDLVFADPPYVFGEWRELALQVERIAPGGHVVIESDRPPELPEHWSVIRERRYGSTLVVIAEIPTQPLERC